MVLLDVVETYRFDTNDSAKNFINDCETNAFSEGYTLKSSSTTLKEKKGEECYIVKVSKHYCDLWEGILDD